MDAFFFIVALAEIFLCGSSLIIAVSEDLTLSPTYRLLSLLTTGCFGYWAYRDMVQAFHS